MNEYNYMQIMLFADKKKPVIVRLRLRHNKTPINTKLWQRSSLAALVRTGESLRTVIPCAKVVASLQGYL